MASSSSSSYLIADASSPLGLAIVEELLLQTPPASTIIAVVDKGKDKDKDAEGSRHLQALREQVYDAQMQAGKSRLCVVDLDVAGSDSRMMEKIGEVVERVGRILQEEGGGGLDCLILNAGLGAGEKDREIRGVPYDWKNEGCEDLTPANLDTPPATDTTTVLHAFLPLLRRGRGRDRKILTLTTTPALDYTCINRGSGTDINTLIRNLSGSLKDEGVAAFLVRVGGWQVHKLHSHSTEKEKEEEEEEKEEAPLEPSPSSPSRAVIGRDKHGEHGDGDGDEDEDEDECECEPDFICPRPCPWAKRRAVQVPRNERELARGCLRVLGRCGVEVAGEVLGWGR
ncbi:hypothetical protein FQN53_005561 [Emmonsiellopsis sp. PD_33]|nr:hypothetical protein FQN53_005561 [Emmonsiellopsis sp. PD_33]